MKKIKIIIFTLVLLASILDANLIEKGFKVDNQSNYSYEKHNYTKEPKIILGKKFDKLNRNGFERPLYKDLKISDTYKNIAKLNAQYIFIRQKQYPYFGIIKGNAIYKIPNYKNNTSWKKFCDFEIKLKSNNDKICLAIPSREISYKEDGIAFTFNLKDIAGFEFRTSIGSYKNNHINLWIYPTTSRENWLNNKINPFNHFDYKKDVFKVIQTKKRISNKFGQQTSYYEIVIFNYLNDINPIYFTKPGLFDPLIGISYTKKGAKSFANQICRHALSKKLKSENNLSWKDTEEKFPKTKDILYKCKKPFESYFVDLLDLIDDYKSQ